MQLAATAVGDEIINEEAVLETPATTIEPTTSEVSTVEAVWDFAGVEIAIFIGAVFVVTGLTFAIIKLWKK